MYSRKQEVIVVNEENVAQTQHVIVDSGAVVVPDFRDYTIIPTDTSEIHIIHEMTLGDVVLGSLLMAILIFMVIDRVIRR